MNDELFRQLERTKQLERRISALERQDRPVRTAGGLIGIGADPESGYDVHIGDTIALGNWGTTGDMGGKCACYLLQHITDTTNHNYGIQSEIVVDLSASSTKYYYGILGYQRTAAKAYDISRVVGVQGQVQNDAITGSTVSVARGVAGFVVNGSSGTITSAYGGIFGVLSSGASGTVTNAYGVLIMDGATTGTVTKKCGLCIDDQTGASGNDHTDLLIGTTTIPGNPYSLYNASSKVSYFAGKVGIGISDGNPLNVYNSGYAGYVAKFRNDGNSATYQGIQIQCGQDANPSADLAQLLDGDGTEIGTIAGDGAGGVNYNKTSDQSRKEHIRDLAGSLGIIRQLRPVTYVGLGQPADGVRQVGLVAQEVRPWVPAAVTENGQGLLSLAYMRLIPYTIGAVQELADRVEALEAKP